jgi:hypothetical protein
VPPPFQGEDSWSIVSNLWWNKNQAFFSHQFPFSSLDLECFSSYVTLFLGELSSLQIDHSSIFFLLWIGLYALLFLWSWLLIGFVKHSEKTSWMGASVFFPTTTKLFKFIYFQCMSVHLMILIVDRFCETFREDLLNGS